MVHALKALAAGGTLYEPFGVSFTPFLIVEKDPLVLSFDPTAALYSTDLRCCMSCRRMDSQRRDVLRILPVPKVTPYYN